MKKIFLCGWLVMGMHGMLCAQTTGDEDKEMFNRAKTRDQQAIDSAIKGWWTASMKTHEDRIAWWQEARFGMFIHWGVYSLPGGEWKGQKVSGYAEHLMRKEKITRNDYLELAHRFNPVLFNADEWAMHAKKAGMKYLVITAKHHDGFAMYPSTVSDFNIQQQTLYKTDPMAALAAACKKQGIKFGFYYSHAFDWEDPDAPGNDWEYNNPGGDKLLHGGTNWFDVHPELLPKAQRYVQEKAIPQIKELLTRYHPDILWFDTPHKLPLSENIRILKAIRETDPNVVVNGRLVRFGDNNFGDYKNTADRPAEFFPVTGDWEAIPTTNESYGYHQFDQSHKPAGFFIRLLAKAASRGGNLLMNIGPKGDGAFDTRDLRILDSIGNWLNRNGSSIYGTTASTLPLQNWGVITEDSNTTYLHVFQWPQDGKLYVGGIKNNVAKAYLLDQKPKYALLTTRITEKNTLVINVPAHARDTSNTVIVLKRNGSIKTDSIYFVAPNVPLTRLLAFDAVQHGKGLKFGDGKARGYFVNGWERTDQWLSWDFRTIAPGKYTLQIKYLAPSGNQTAGAAGSPAAYRVTLNAQSVERTVRTDSRDFITEELFTIDLPKGTHHLKVQPVAINNDLMRLLECQLIQKQ